MLPHRCEDVAPDHGHVEVFAGICSHVNSIPVNSHVMLVSVHHVQKPVHSHVSVVKQLQYNPVLVLYGNVISLVERDYLVVIIYVRWFVTMATVESAQEAEIENVHVAKHPTICLVLKTFQPVVIHAVNFWSVGYMSVFRDVTLVLVEVVVRCE